jgi:hypothetical protein
LSRLQADNLDFLLSRTHFGPHASINHSAYQASQGLRSKLSEVSEKLRFTVPFAAPGWLVQPITHVTIVFLRYLRTAQLANLHMEE